MTSPGDGGQQAGGQVTGGGVQPGTGSSGQGQGKAAGGQQQGGKSGGQQGGQQSGQQAPQDDNGLYAKYLEGVPAAVHPQMIAAFKEWEGGITQQQQQVRSQYEPWQGLIDGGGDPQRAQVGMDFLDWLQENPAEALPIIAQQLGVDLGSPAGAAGDQGEQYGAADEGLAGEYGSQDPDGEIPPWFAQFRDQITPQLQEMQGQWQLLAQHAVERHQAEQQEQEVGRLEAELTPLLQQAGINPDDPSAHPALNVIFSAMEQGASVPDAVAQWTSLVESVRGQQQGSAQPPLLGGGGGMPSEQVDPQSLSQKDRRAAAVAYARSLQGGG